MRLKSTKTSPPQESWVWVMGPAELAKVLVEQYVSLGFQVKAIATPRDENELREVLSVGPQVEARYVHPCLSKWAERPEFPIIAAEKGWIPISPSPRVLSLYRNKIGFFSEAEAAGIPHAALSLDPLMSAREITAAFSRLKHPYPIVLKSVHGGAGHGVLCVRDPQELEKLTPVWLEQLRHHHEEAIVIMERYLPSARHLIVPFVAFGEGDIVEFPWIDASLQARWRRMIQFCPAVATDSEAEKKIRSILSEWIKRTDYRGMGSLEFFVDGSSVYLMDGAARINAAFPLWEEMMHVQSVEWQMAGLGYLPRPKFPSEFRWKTGLSLRLYAEDPVRQIPTPGWIQEMSEPRVWDLADTRARFITAYTSESEVPIDSSGVLGELFVFSQERKHLIQSARKFLQEIWIAGSLETNRRFIVEHLDHPFVRENFIHAGFTDEEFLPEPHPDPITQRKMVTLASQLFFAQQSRWIVNNRWVEPETEELHWIVGPEEFTANKLKGYSGVVRFKDFKQERVLLFPMGENRWWVTLGLWCGSVRRVVPGQTQKPTPTKERKLLALTAGRVHAILHRPGTEVEASDRLLVLESLSTLVPHAVPQRVKILRWNTLVDQKVTQGQELAVLELLD